MRRRSSAGSLAFALATGAVSFDPFLDGGSVLRPLDPHGDEHVGHTQEVLVHERRALGDDGHSQPAPAALQYDVFHSAQQTRAVGADPLRRYGVGLVDEQVKGFAVLVVERFREFLHESSPRALAHQRYVDDGWKTSLDDGRGDDVAGGFLEGHVSMFAAENDDRVSSLFAVG